MLLKKRGLARAILHNLAIASSMDPSFSLGSSKARVAVGNKMVLSKYAREQRHYGVLTVTSFTERVQTCMLPLMNIKHSLN